MSRTFIDVNMFSVPWFKPVLKELISCKKVMFPFGNSIIFNREYSKARKALEFYTLIGELVNESGEKRRIDVPKGEIEKFSSVISKEQCFIDSDDCDDPHIFALLYIKPTPFVFSTDRRIARCRDHINRFVDSRYCGFIVISSENVYNRHRHEILS